MRSITRRLLIAALLATALAGSKVVSSPPCRFAAIAYSESKHSYGCAYGLGSRAAAEQAAVRSCGSGDAESVVWTRNQWCALALDLDGNARGWGWHSTAAGAQARALAECRKLCDNCYVAVCVSACGTVMEYKPPVPALASLPKPKELPELPEEFFPAELP